MILEMKCFDKKMYWILFLTCLLSNVRSAKADKSVTGTENGQVTIKCQHGAASTMVQTIFWEARSNGKILAELFNGTVRNVHPKFLGRVSMSESDGDLTIIDISRSDDDHFKCLTIQNGVRAESKEGWIKLNVNVKPENFKIMCSGNTYATPGEDCKHIKRESIKSIQCQVYSSPISYIVWSKIPPGCSIERSGETAEMGLLHKRTSKLTGLCDGEYCCLAEYDRENARILKTCVTVGDPSDPKTDLVAGKPPDKDLIPGENKSNLIIGIVCVIVAVVVIVILIIACKYLDRSRLREDYPVLCRCCPLSDVHDFKPDNISVTSSPNMDELPDIITDVIDNDIDPIRYSQNEPLPMTSAMNGSPPKNVLRRQASLDDNDGAQVVKSANTPSAQTYSDMDQLDGPVDQCQSETDPFLQLGKDGDQDNDVVNKNNTSSGEGGLFSRPHDTFLDDTQITNNVPPMQDPLALRISIYKKRKQSKNKKPRYTEASAYPT